MAMVMVVKPVNIICNNNGNVVIGVPVLLPLTSGGEYFTLHPVLNFLRIDSYKE